MELSVRALLQQFLLSPAADRLRGFRRRAALALANCKTAALGAHVRRCPHGHLEGIWYNSCRHRSCPQCGLLDADRWLQRRLTSILPCPHYHLVFTLPSCLNVLWQLNSRALTNLLFRSARWALRQLLDDPRYLAGSPGVLAVLHTWGRTLCLHPHLHCLVTAGGLDADDRWRQPIRSILVPQTPLGLLFRGHFLRHLETLLRNGKLRLPSDLRLDDALLLLISAAATKWTPRIQEVYRHGDGVVRYLARYVRGGPFRNHQLISCQNGRVVFGFRNWRQLDPQRRPCADTLSLDLDEFLRRLLAHVPAPHTRTVRGWGLYAHTQRKRADLARLQISPAAQKPQTRVATPRRPAALYCNTCHARLLVLHITRNARPPPSLTPCA